MKSRISALAYPLAIAAILGLGWMHTAAATEGDNRQERPLDARALLAHWTNALPVSSAPKGPDYEADQEKLTPGAQATLRQANKYLRDKQLEAAVAAYNDVLKEAPANRRARFGLGTTYIQMGRHQEALDILEAMLKEFPSDYTLKNNTAWLYATASDEQFRDGDRATLLAQEALFLEPNDYRVWSTLAEAHFVAGRFEKAEKAAREALQLGAQLRAGAFELEGYKTQIRRCREAAKALSVID